MNSKKGVSDIVVTILLVLLALAAVAMVWAFISGYIGNAKGKIAQSQACMDLSLVPVSCQLTGGAFATVTYKMGSSAVNLTDIKILVEKKDGSVVPQDTSLFPKAYYVPAPLETKVVTTSVLVADAKRFSVAGVLTIDGKEVFCTESDKVECK